MNLWLLLWVLGVVLCVRAMVLFYEIVMANSTEVLVCFAG